MANILVVHGPNLNLLGMPEIKIYGNKTLDDISHTLKQLANVSNLTCECYHSNHEGAIVEKLQQSKDQVQFIILNPAAYTHTSIAIRDALLAINIPFVETHLSNPAAREDFRRRSYFSDIAYGVIAGFGPVSYQLAMQAAIDYCQKT